MARLYSAPFRFGSSSSSCSSIQDDRCTRVTKPLKSLLFILVCSLLLFCTNSPLPPGFFLVLSGTTKINVGGTVPRGLQLSSEGTAQQENVTALCVGRETQGGVWVELEKEYAWHHPIIDKLPGGQCRSYRESIGRGGRDGRDAPKRCCFTPFLTWARSDRAQ
jgi:hypothetical protein